MEELLSRKKPVSLDAEQAVIGSILMDPDIFDRVAAILNEEDFAFAEHRAIYATLRGMLASSRTIDLVTLISALEEQGALKESGGAGYLRDLVNAVPSSVNALDYARIVRAKSLQRRLIETCESVAEEAYTGQGTVEQMLDNAEQRIFDLADKRDTREFRHIKDILLGVYDQLELLSTDKNAAAGTPTGFSGLDNVLVGMGKGDLIIVGARPGMGKTSFVLNIATNVARTTGKKVCIFSLEMSAEQLATRMLSSEAMVDSFSLRSGKIADEDWAKLAQAVTSLSGSELYVDDSTGLSVTQMKGKLRRMKNLGLVIIDYLQLMQGEKRTDNRATEVADISRNLKIMGKDLGVPVICCAQLSRGTEQRTGANKRPQLSDLRESGAIEQDADVVLFIYREDYYGTDDKVKEESNIAEVIVSKNRHGATRTVKMGWIPQYTKFRTIEGEREEP